ncbi:DNA cytosine methyltransferase [Agarivorans albus]
MAATHYQVILMSVKAIDLFAGAGGFTLAAINAGVNVLAAIEFDKAAADTYDKNFNRDQACDIQLLNEDINNIEPTVLRGKLKLKRGELDLILGGPPCQGFSTHRIKDAGKDDPRNALLLRYFEFVHEFRPKAFLVENVAGLLWERHSKYLEKFLALAKQEKYSVRFCNALNAKDYGVPQNRKRVFIFAVREDVNSDNIAFPPGPTHYSVAEERTPKWRTASSVFEPIPESLYESFWTNYFSKKTKMSKKETFELLASLDSGKPLPLDDICNVYMQPSDMMVSRFSRIGPNGSREDLGQESQLKCHSNGYNGHKDVYGRIFVHLPSNTITTGCNNPSKGRFVHPWENHGMTLRHAARLQSFPDWFKFYGSSTEQARQIGNAVPPLLGQVLIEHICSRLN